MTLVKINSCKGFIVSLKGIVILKEHLQPYIRVVPSLFQEATYCELVFSRYYVSLKQAIAVIPFYKGIELIRNSSSRHPLDE